jgi:hypothetical protein
VTDDITARGRRGARRLRTGAVLAVVTVAAVIAGLVLWLGSPSAPAPSTPAAVDATAVFTPPPGPAGGGVPTSIPPVTIPTDLTWADVAGVALPQSGVTGPTDRSGGLARGFTHDPAGAIFAAANILIRINPQAGPGLFTPTLKDQVVGPDAADLKDQVDSAYETLRDQAGVAYGQPVGHIYATLRGFRIEQYSDVDVWLRLLSEGPDGSGGSVLAAMLLQMRWTGTDWALVAPVGGTFDSSASLVTTTGSYTFFVAR